jgi:hypothetical protein
MGGRSPPDAGHNHMGWTMASGTGRIVADLVVGRRPEHDLMGLGPRVVAGGQAGRPAPPAQPKRPRDPFTLCRPGRPHTHRPGNPSKERVTIASLVVGPSVGEPQIPKEEFLAPVG